MRSVFMLLLVLTAFFLVPSARAEETCSACQEDLCCRFDENTGVTTCSDGRFCSLTSSVYTEHWYRDCRTINECQGCIGWTCPLNKNEVRQPERRLRSTRVTKSEVPTGARPEC